jgi:acetoin:2,6-dichlorophenolindophenol oxidoreductase subunit beta
MFSPAPARELTLVQALNEALHEEMQRDDRVVVLGEDVGRFGGVYKVTEGLLGKFGSRRVRDAPISEAAIVGVGVGAAMTGMRPVVEIMFGDFLCLAMDQIVNQAAKVRYMSGGKWQVPLVVRTTLGAGRRIAAQHSQSLHALFAHIPGVKVVVPSSPADAKVLLKASIRDDDPVIFFEDKLMYREKGTVAEGDGAALGLGRAEIKRKGGDVTVVATSSMVGVALEAAARLSSDGIELEVVDPRTLTPLDMETIVESVRKTSRCVVVDEGYTRFGATAEIAATVAREAFFFLEAPVERIGAMDVPVPFSPALEDLTIPGPDTLVASVRTLLS